MYTTHVIVLPCTYIVLVVIVVLLISPKDTKSTRQSLFSYQFSTMHTASYEFLMKPKESAGCHQTLSQKTPNQHVSLFLPHTPPLSIQVPTSFALATLPMLKTRQMMIIAGGEPELCRRRHAKREGGVYAPPRRHYVSILKSCPECSVYVYMLCLCREV